MMDTRNWEWVDLDEPDGVVSLPARQLPARRPRRAYQIQRQRMQLEGAWFMVRAAWTLVISLMILAGCLMFLLFRQLDQPVNTLAANSALIEPVVIASQDCQQVSRGIALEYCQNVGMDPTICQTTPWSNGGMTMLLMSNAYAQNLSMIVTCDGLGEVNINCVLYERGIPVGSFQDSLKLKPERLGDLLEDLRPILEWQDLEDQPIKT